MPDCKITYKEDKGFWIEEVFMQLIYHYIYDELIKPQYNVPNKNQLLDEIKFHIDGYSTGVMSLGWYGFIESDVEIQTMIQVLENVKLSLNNKGQYISVSELQSIPTEDDEFKFYYSTPFPIPELIKVLNALIQMLNNTWTSKTYDMKIAY
jgi:hypothetical protein